MGPYEQFNKGWGSQPLLGCQLPSEVVDSPSLSVLKRHLGDALINMLWLLVSPEMVRELDQ